MRALVTGHEGFIGRHLTKALALSDAYTKGFGYDVRARLGHDIRECLPRRGDRYDVVFHCAAMVDGREAIEGKAAVLGAYNLQLDGALFEWALRTRPGRVVYFSSSAAYPVSLQHPRGNAMSDYWNAVPHAQPDGTYGWVKITGERIAHEVRKAGIPVTIVRPFSGYGEDQDECYPFPAMIARAKRGDDPFEVWGDGKQVRDFVHVDDIVGAVLALAEAGVDGPVNIGTGIGTSMDDLARLAMRAAGYEAPIKHLTDKPVGVQYRVADTTLLNRYYTPKVTLAEGVRRALACAGI